MQLKGTLYYYAVNMRYSLMIFWGILMGIMLLSLITELIFSAEGGEIFFSFTFPIYIFALIIGTWVVKNVIPYLVKMGITRGTIYIGTGIVFILIALFNGVIANTVHFIVTDVIGSSVNNSFEISANGESISGTSSLISLFAEDTWWNRFVIDVAIQFFCVTVSFLFGMIFYRYKLIGGAAVLAVLLFVFIYSITSGWLYDTVMHIVDGFSMVFFYQLFFVGLVIYLISHFLIRKLTI